MPLATSVGDIVASRLVRLREDELQRELVSAGFFGDRRPQVPRLPRAARDRAAARCSIWLLSLDGASVGLIFLVALVGLS